MNQYEMVVLIVLVMTIAGVFRAKYKFQSQATPPADHQDAIRMREEIRTLKERIAVLERIATDRTSALEHEIEQLRDR